MLTSPIVAVLTPVRLRPRTSWPSLSNPASLVGGVGDWLFEPTELGG